MEKTYLGENLYTLRKKKGLSQEELADQLGVSRQAISKWERNEAYPDTENLIAIARLYGVSLDALVSTRISAFEQGAESPCVEAGSEFDREDPNETGDASPNKENGENEDQSRFRVKVSSNGGIKVDVTASDAALEEDDDDDEDEDEDEDDPAVIESKKKFRFWYAIPYPIVITVAYLLMGFLWEKGWEVGWTLYVTIPVYYTLIDCIRRKKLTPFCYPVLMAFFYVFIGMMWDVWHPTWIMFVTIPIFYSIAPAIDKRNRT